VPLLRPTLARRALPAITSLASGTRNASNVPAEEPKKKAQSIIDALPGSNLVSKTAILSAAAGTSVYAISNEYYVLNEETVVAFCLLAVWGAIFKYGGPMYKQWAETQHDKIKGILVEARADHTQAVKDRIVDVQQMGGVVEITKALFEVSKVRSSIPV
jgi:F-type H+-transporting ATPase subunit b